MLFTVVGLLLACELAQATSTKFEVKYGKIMTPQSLEALSATAEHDGLFFFALLFTLVITVFANKWNRDVSRQQPPASFGDLVIYRSYFVACAIVSFVLVGLSVWYWISNQNRQHFLELEVVGLAEGEFLGSENLMRAELPRYDPDTKLRVKDYKFVLRKTSPFKKGEELRLKYWTGQEGDGSIGKIPESKFVSMHILEERPWLSYRFRLEKTDNKVVLVQIQN